MGSSARCVGAPAAIPLRACRSVPGLPGPASCMERSVSQLLPPTASPRRQLLLTRPPASYCLLASRVRLTVSRAAPGLHLAFPLQVSVRGPVSLPKFPPPAAPILVPGVQSGPTMPLVPLWGLTTTNSPSPAQFQPVTHPPDPPPKLPGPSPGPHGLLLSRTPTPR